MMATGQVVADRDLPGVPQHIVQRGNNRLPCSLDDDDCLRYLTLLHEALLATGVRLHAYVLMDNHVHLLATPPALGDVGRMPPHVERGRRAVAPPLPRAASRPVALTGRTGAAIIEALELGVSP